MSKLLRLRKWLTVADAAKYLSSLLDETVNEPDLLRLALDDYLVISVLFINGAVARHCAKVRPDEIEYVEIPSLDGERLVRMPVGGHVWGDARGTFQASPRIVELAGVFDLPLSDGGRIDVEYRYHQLCGNAEVTRVTLDGLLVQNTHGELYELQASFKDNEFFKGKLKTPYFHPDNFHPAGGLPEDAILVFRLEELGKFVHSLGTDRHETTAEWSVSSAAAPAAQDMAPSNQAANDLLSKHESTGELDCDGVQITPNERNTLLLIIAALAEKAGIDPAHHKSASAISGLISLLGASVSSPTIRDKLNMIPAAVARREVVVGRKRTGK